MALPAFLAGAFALMSRAAPMLGRGAMGFAGMGGFGGFGGAAMKRTAAGAAANAWPTTMGTTGMADQAAKAGTSLGQLRSASLKTALALYAMPKAIQFATGIQMAGQQGIMRFSPVGVQAMAQLEINRLRRDISLGRKLGPSFAQLARGIDSFEKDTQGIAEASKKFANLVGGAAATTAGFGLKHLGRMFLVPQINDALDKLTPPVGPVQVPYVFDFLHRLGQRADTTAILRRMPGIHSDRPIVPNHPSAINSIREQVRRWPGFTF